MDAINHIGASPLNRPETVAEPAGIRSFCLMITINRRAPGGKSTKLSHCYNVEGATLRSVDTFQDSS